MKKERIIFVFPGQGTFGPGIARQMCRETPDFDQNLRRLTFIFSKFDCDLKYILFKADRTELADTRNAQPAGFCLSYLMARHLIDRKIEPDFLVGHSLGEFVAAVIAGIFDLTTAISLVIKRAELLSTCAPGSMIAVTGPLASVERLIARTAPEVDIAVFNGPNASMLSGPVASIDRLGRAFEQTGMTVRHLAAAHAYHSAMMDPIVPQWRLAVEAAHPRSADSRFLSTVYPGPEGHRHAGSVEYWVDHLRGPVRFAQAVGAAPICGDRPTLWLEMSGRSLTGRAIDDLGQEVMGTWYSKALMDEDGGIAAGIEAVHAFQSGHPVT